MTQRQIEFLRALLVLAMETHSVLGMDEWTGEEKFENWTRDETIELDKLLEEVSK